MVLNEVGIVGDWVKRGSFGSLASSNLLSPISSFELLSHQNSSRSNSYIQMPSLTSSYRFRVPSDHLVNRHIRPLTHCTRYITLRLLTEEAES